MRPARFFLIFRAMRCTLATLASTFASNTPRRRSSGFGDRGPACPIAALEIARQNLDLFAALWSMCTALRRDRLPHRRVVIRFEFSGRPRRERRGPIQRYSPALASSPASFSRSLALTSG